jgi:hypothetical protein
MTKASPAIHPDDVPHWHASNIAPLYGMTTKQFQAALAKGDIKVGKIGGSLVDTPRNAREQIARKLGRQA